MISLKKAFGLDIGSSSAKIVSLSRDNKQINYFIEEYKKDEHGNISQESIITAIKELINKNNLSKKNFIISIPRHHFVVRKLTSPFKDANKISQTINYEIEPLIPYPINDINLDFFISNITKTSEISIFILNKKTVKLYLDIISACEINAISLTSSDIAEFNYLYKNFSKENIIEVLINLGAKNITLTVIKDNKWDFSRSINKAGDFLTEFLATNLTIPFLEAEKIKINSIVSTQNNEFEEILQKGLSEIFNEIRYTLNSYQADSNIKKIDKIYLTGGGSNIKNVKQKLVQYLNIDAKIILLEELDKQAVLFGPALGCAIQQKTSAKETISLNFLPKSNLTSFKEKIQIILNGSLIFLILLTFWFNTYFQLKIKEKKLNLIDNEIKKIFNESFPNIKSSMDEKQYFINAINAEKKNSEIFFSGLSLNNEHYPMEIFKELSTIIDNKTTVEIRELNINENSVMLNGKTISFREVDKIKNKLKESKYFNKITVDSLKTTNDGRIEFKINVKF